MKLTDRKQELEEHIRWARGEADRGWYPFFAIFPRQDWFSGDLYVGRVERMYDFQTGNYFYRDRPKP